MSPNVIAMAWDALVSINGKTIMYEVVYLPTNTADNEIDPQILLQLGNRYHLTKKNLVFIGNLVTNTSYTLFVRAYTTDGRSPYSIAVVAETLDTLEDVMAENLTDALETSDAAMSKDAPKAATATTESMAEVPLSISGIPLRESYYTIGNISRHEEDIASNPATKGPGTHRSRMS